MNHLKDLTNEQLRTALLHDMKSYHDGSRDLDDDNVDETVSCIEEVFRHIDVYSDKRNLWSIVHDPENGEWQVSDGDVGERSTSYDFKTKEEAEEWIRAQGGAA